MPIVPGRRVGIRWFGDTKGENTMKKTVSAIVLALALALVGTTGALAAPSEQGVANGLSRVCGGPAAMHNPHCGW
jgi:hypothetical protein